MRRLKNIVGAPPTPTPKAAEARGGEPEDALPLQEELSLLREEETESRQVDLLLVHLDLGEVGVVGEVGREVLGYAIFYVQARVGVAVVGDLGVDGQVGPRPCDAVGLHLEVATRGWCLDPHECPVHRDPEGPDVPGPHRERERSDVVYLVPAHDRALHLDTPHLLPTRPIPERLERDGHLDRPPAVEERGAGLPDGIPVIIGTALVRKLSIVKTSDGVSAEVSRIPTIVERVQIDREAIARP